MSITTAKSNNMKSYLKVLVMFLITIIIALLPPFGAITPLGMKVLGVFVVSWIPYGSAFMLWLFWEYYLIMS